MSIFRIYLLGLLNLLGITSTINVCYWNPALSIIPGMVLYLHINNSQMQAGGFCSHISWLCFNN